MPSNRIAVLAPVSTLDHQPGILNAVTCFLEAGYDVDVFAVRNVHYPSPDLGNARVRYLPVRFNSQQDPRLFVTVAYTIWLIFAMRGDYRAVFAGGIRALMAAWVNSWWRPLRIINLQLELYIGPKLNTRFGRLFKWAERRAVRKSWLSLIHDVRRAEMLAADVGVDISKIEIVPNSPLGPSHPQTSDYLKELLGLPQSSKILLAPGTFGKSFMSEEIVGAAQSLPDDWYCVLHSAQPRAKSDPYIRQLIAANTRDRVRFSLQPVPYDAIDEVLASGRIGLALYGKAGGANTTEVGLASGKLCQFLKIGIPVIVSDYPVLRQFVQDHGVGVAVDELSELVDAIKKIDADYAAYRQRAALAFDEVLAFEGHFSKVLARLNDELVA